MAGRTKLSTKRRFVWCEPSAEFLLAVIVFSQLLALQGNLAVSSACLHDLETGDAIHRTSFLESLCTVGVQATESDRDRLVNRVTEFHGTVQAFLVLKIPFLVDSGHSVSVYVNTPSNPA